MALTSQEKLALALTSAGSMRQLAELVGVSHQQVGRWLREGEAGGVKRIPDWARGAIDQAFQMHADVARWQAKQDKLPFDPRMPVFAARKPLTKGPNAGALGDRVFVEHTQFIRTDTRERVMASKARSGGYLAGSVRSVINLYRYTQRVVDDEIARGRRRPETRQRSIDSMMRLFAERQGLDYEAHRHKLVNELRENVTLRPIFTQYESLKPTNAEARARAITRKLQAKHEPATGDEGTRLADQFLFQLTPAYAKRNQVKPRQQTRRRTRRDIGKK